MQIKIEVDFPDCEFQQFAEERGFHASFSCPGIAAASKVPNFCRVPCLVDGEKEEVLIAPLEARNFVVRSQTVSDSRSCCKISDSDIRYYAQPQDGMYWILETIFGGDYEVTYKGKGKGNDDKDECKLNNDPAYKCPYCGGLNCEFDEPCYAPPPAYNNGVELDTQFWCKDCARPYKVTWEMKVKKVCPDESVVIDEDLLAYATNLLYQIRDKLPEGCDVTTGPEDDPDKFNIDSLLDAIRKSHPNY